MVAFHEAIVLETYRWFPKTFTAEVSMIEKIHLFETLDNDTLNFFNEVAVSKTYPKNTVLFTKGDETNALYIIEKGKVKSILMDEEGKEMILNIHGPGECFGEIALIDGQPRSATVMTKETTRVTLIYKKDFLSVLDNNMSFAKCMMKLLIERLRRATENIERLVFQDVYGRVVNVLLQLSRDEGDKKIVEESLTHQEISNMVGSSREMVSKILKELTNGGYLTIEKKTITINKQLPLSF